MENLYPAKVGHQYKVNFAKYESFILTLDGKDVNQY